MVLKRRGSGPHAAPVLPNGFTKRFTVVVEGIDADKLRTVWSRLCNVGHTPPSAAFREVYPYLTTVQDNRFQFRGGDPQQLGSNLQTLLRESTKVPTVTVRVEEC